MNPKWEQVVIHRVTLAMYVYPHNTRRQHTNRPFHGFVLNASDDTKIYSFSDGQELHALPGSLFYLPKGSSYDVNAAIAGGCYAINFDADIVDDPFVFFIKNMEQVTKNFRVAAEEWKRNSSLGRICALRALYDVIYRAQRDSREYMSQHTADKIAPALELLDTRFTDSSLTVAELAQLCGMSQVYFRKIVQNRFGMSPKEYLIQKRMEYAKQLLLSGQFAVNEVAALCGYSEPCHFSREFSARVGVPPRGFGMQTGAMDNLDRK